MNYPTLFDYQKVNEPQGWQFSEVQMSYTRKYDYRLEGEIYASDKAAEIFRKVFSPGTVEYKEFFFVILIDRAAHVLGVLKVSEGGMSATSVDVRVIMQAALLSCSSSLILCHNHPSGTLKPSIEDCRLTKKIEEAAKLFDIRVNDHIIITQESYYSFADNGRL